MLSSKEALNSLKSMACIEAGHQNKYITYAKEMEHNEMVEEKYYIIEKELDRLEKLEQENQELKEDFLKPIGFICRTKEKAMLQNQKLIYLANKYNLPITIIDSETNKKYKKLENALEIIKNKKVNIFHIWAFDDYTQYKEHYPFSEYSAEEDMLNQEEFDFLKEVFEYD